MGGRRVGEYYSEHETRTPVWPEVERIGLATGATVRLVLKAEFHTRCEPTAASSEHCWRIFCRSLTRMGWPWVVPLITCVCSQSRINPVISSPRPRGASSATSRAITGSHDDRVEYDAGSVASVLIVVGVHRQLLQHLGGTDRPGGCRRNQHNTDQTGGSTRGEGLGDLAAHGVANEDVVGVRQCGDDQLRIVGEARKS